ncbi:hypothetical protein KFL_006510030 [Klebsormidium nitens]|uniref:BTB domain-containing protein n=1 Tax=Klebsormidium nitens TaxID=105231 RepID=A0A1Y1IM44_KLENI|nr:hypothetical protein KFL_006510030 [Klebsormidium nitens]|eukprot:GAQ90519.1 hypothetical protein KFL_006510030 [Klebsormidium nitens]
MRLHLKRLMHPRDERLNDVLGDVITSPPAWPAQHLLSHRHNLDGEVALVFDKGRHHHVPHPSSARVGSAANLFTATFQRQRDTTASSFSASLLAAEVASWRPPAVGAGCSHVGPKRGRLGFGLGGRPLGRPAVSAASKDEEGEAGSMHLTFAYGSAVTQFSDRRIRVRVVPDQEQAGRGEVGEAAAAGQDKGQGPEQGPPTTDAAEQHVAADLEMQPKPDHDPEGGGGYELPVSSLVLAARSPYFRQMLSSDWQESGSKDRPIEVALCQEGRNFPQAKNLFVIFTFRCSPTPDHYLQRRPSSRISSSIMYRRKIPAAVQDKEALCWLLQVADRFETPACVGQCVARLLSTAVTLPDAALYVALPQPLKTRPALRRLMDAVCALTGWSYDEVTRADSLAAMSFERMVELAHTLRGQGEHAEALLQLLLEWLRADAAARWNSFSVLLPLLEVPGHERIVPAGGGALPRAEQPRKARAPQVCPNKSGSAECGRRAGRPAGRAGSAGACRRACRSSPRTTSTETKWASVLNHANPSYRGYLHMLVYNGQR